LEGHVIKGKEKRKKEKRKKKGKGKERKNLFLPFPFFPSFLSLFPCFLLSFLRSLAYSFIHSFVQFPRFLFLFLLPKLAFNH